MEVRYNKLWKLLIDRQMTKTQLRLDVGLSTVTLARMNKGMMVRVATLKRICESLKCKPSDIMETARKKG